MTLLFLSSLLLGGFQLEAQQIVLQDELPECPVHRVMAGMLDSDNVLWVVGERSGIFTWDLKDPAKSNWNHISAGEEFDPETNYYAIAEDRQGRIWVGTDNRGVMVYNRQEWESYTVDNALLSNRVYGIAVSPLTGEVAIASSGGVTVYNPKDGSWKDYYRGNGLLENQVNALTFSEDGELWLAYACGGVTRGFTMRPVETWVHIQAPWHFGDKGYARQPLTFSGEGLPTNLCNSIICSSGKVWLATCAGIAYSPLKGMSWRYMRGLDYQEKNEGTYNPGKPVKREMKKPANLLSQDFITVITPAKQGLWVGTRDKGICRWSPHNGMMEKAKLPAQYGKYEITALVSLPDGSLGYGTNGKGFGILKNGSGRWVAGKGRQHSGKLPQIPPLPPKGMATGLMADAVRVETGSDGIYVGEDWMTKGDWPGRYGNVYALLCSSDGEGMDGRYTTGFVFGNRKQYLAEGMYVLLQDYEIKGFAGPNRRGRETYASRLYDDDSSDRNALLNPGSLARKLANWDDRGADYHPAWDGPDLWVKLVVPEGNHLLDLYFYNNTDNTADSLKADFYIEMRKTAAVPAELGSGKKDAAQEIEELYSLPVIARARVSRFSGSGVYQKFAAAGEGIYWFRVCRNNSPAATLNGVFVSKLSAPLDVNPEAIRDADVYFDKLVPVPPLLDHKNAKENAEFLNLWDSYMRCNKWSPSAWTMLNVGLLNQYKLLANGDNSLKERLRWELGIISKSDRILFDRFIAELREKRYEFEHDGEIDS